MKFIVERETLLKPLLSVVGVIEKKQTLPVLANVLLIVKKNELTLVGTDVSIELRGRVSLTNPSEEGAITVPAHKFLDICKALPEQSKLEIFTEEHKVIVRSGRSRFTLMTLPASDFPDYEETAGQHEFTIQQTELRKLIERTSFAMALQDVRYYLNGMLWEIGDKYLRAVATDGHRMALSDIDDPQIRGQHRLIVPRKSIFELSRLLSDAAGTAEISVNTKQIRVSMDGYTFASKLIDGQFPNYDKVIPKSGAKTLIIDRDVFKQALSHVTTLANDKHRSVRVELWSGLMKLSTNNLEQEVAEEEISINYQGVELDIGFNANYLLDVLNAMPVGNIKLTFSDADGSTRIEDESSGKSVYVLMPMRL